MIRQMGSGTYTFLPLGMTVLNKVQDIVREEMNATGAQEILMPILQPAELWHESGRWDDYGPELMRLNDRHERELCLGPRTRSSSRASCATSCAATRTFLARCGRCK